MALPTSDLVAAPAVAVVADACFITSHRLTEWISNAPTMEEDVAIGNVALDLLGQARGLFAHLGDENQLAYLRDPADWHHPVICELPNGDFGYTMLRQLFVDAWLQRVWEAFANVEAEVVRGVAEKAIKENAYHVRHSTAWVERLGDGTAESHRRMFASLGALWPYTAELAIPGWYDAISEVLGLATLPVPPVPLPAGPTTREHTMHLNKLLAESQSLAREHPDATW
jgi:ring-1,2-phenylacetyl-CoA epoxidase subunit PaaC